MFITATYLGVIRQLPNVSAPMTYDLLLQHCIKCFPALATVPFTVTYTDDEGDQVLIGTDFELQDILSLLGGGTLSLKLVSTAVLGAPPPPAAGAAAIPDGVAAARSAVLSPPAFSPPSKRSAAAAFGPPPSVASLSAAASGSVAAGGARGLGAGTRLHPDAAGGSGWWPPGRAEGAGGAGAAGGGGGGGAAAKRRAATLPRGERYSTAAAAAADAAADAAVAAATAGEEVDDDDGGGVGGGGGGTEEERKLKKRERNRVNAKKSRLRKKFFIDSLKVTIDQLKGENEDLKAQLQALKHREAGNQPRVNVVLEDAKVLGRSYCLTNPALQDNPIVYASESFCVLTGYSRSEVIGRNCRFLQGPQTDSAALTRIRDSLARGLDVSEVIINYRKDGRAFWNHLMMSALRDENGKVTHYIGVQQEMAPTAQAGSSSRVSSSRPAGAGAGAGSGGRGGSDGGGVVARGSRAGP